MTETDKSIRIKNIGPIDELDIHIEPGVTVLRGPNGAGKSIALNGISRLAGNDKIKPPIRDGASRGEIEGCGVHVNISARVTDSGALEFSTIEGKFDISALVDGNGIKSPAAADAWRIKALLKLRNAPSDQSIFYDLVGGQEAYEALAIKPTDDLVEHAARVKRALEDAARKHETEADRLDGQWSAWNAEKIEYGEDIERDGEKLNAALEAAISAKASIDTKHESYITQAQARVEAQAKLDALPPTDLPELQADVEEVSFRVLEAQELVAKLEAEIAAARKSLENWETQKEAAIAAEAAEAKRCAERATFEAILAAELAPGPTPEALSAAVAAVSTARQAAETGIKARMADRQAIDAKQTKEMERKHRRVAEQLRDSAKSTENILTDMVAQLGVDLIVHEGRLALRTDRGEKPEVFADLSQGERSKVATELCCRSVGETGLLAIPQEFWEGLDPENKRAVADIAKSHGVYMVTAEAALGELRAETFSG